MALSRGTSPSLRSLREGWGYWEFGMFPSREICELLGNYLFFRGRRILILREISFASRSDDASACKLGVALLRLEVH
jgi:hypothetical protein